MVSIWPRQTQAVETPDGEIFFVNERTGFWYTRTGQIVRSSIFLGLFTLFILYMVIGYWHAKRRLNKGLAPLAYHRWLLNRKQRAINEPAYQNPQVFYNTYPNQGYNMQPMPPPMYNPNAAMPPTYYPPEGATKVDPSQWRAEPTRRPAETGGGEQAPGYEYDAPGRPPPAAQLRPDNTGASNNPYERR